MAKPELGTKRVCLSCGAKYYDLMRDPIVCPKCGAVFAVAASEKPVPEEPEEAEAKPEADDTAEGAVVANAEVVSLEEVDDDDSDDDDSDDDETAAAAVIPDIEDVEVDDEDSDDDAFLDDDEEDDGDVSGILGDVASEDEET